LRVVLGDEAGKVDSGGDAQLAEDLAEMEFHGVS
jgi:hypothetical protein